MIFDDEILVEELYKYCSREEHRVLKFLLAKHRAAEKNKPEKKKCPHCGKMFWQGSAMRAHQKAKGHTDAIIGWYEALFAKRLYFARSLELMQRSSDDLAPAIIKFHRYENHTKFNGEVNGQS